MTVAAAGLTGLDGADAKADETIEFKLQNDTDGTRELEIVDPSGQGRGRGRGRQGRRR